MITIDDMKKAVVAALNENFDYPCYEFGVVEQWNIRVSLYESRKMESYTRKQVSTALRCRNCSYA